MNSNEIVCPGAIERYLSLGATIAEWKSIECIMGAVVTRGPGMASSERLLMVKRMRSPTLARTTGPGTVSPKVQALYFTPGAISMILCVMSSRISLTGAGSSGLSAASMLSALPAAKGPVWRSLVTTAVGEPKAMCLWSYGSPGRCRAGGGSAARGGRSGAGHRRVAVATGQHQGQERAEDDPAQRADRIESHVALLLG